MTRAHAFLLFLIACRPTDRRPEPQPTVDAALDASALDARDATDANATEASDAADATADAAADAAGSPAIGQYGRCTRTTDCARGLECCVRPVGVQRRPEVVPPKECLTPAQCRLRPP